jgi:hypothetical protein
VSRLWAVRCAVRFAVETRDFIFSKRSRTAMVPFQPSRKWALPELFPNPVCKVDHFNWCLMNEWSCTSALLNVSLCLARGNFTTTFRMILCPDVICVSPTLSVEALCCITQQLRNGSSCLKALIWIDCTVEVTRVCNLECFPLFFFRVTALKDGRWTWTTCLQDVRYWILTPQSHPCMIPTVKRF